MRVKITADIGNGITLPINYNHLLVGVIYRFLSESNPAFADFLHEEGFHAAEKRFKLFTFSQLMAERRHITGEQIHFRSTLTWSVSSPVVQFLTHFADTLLTEGRLSIGDRHLRVRDVTIPRAPCFRSEMFFRCLSPVVMSAVREVDGNRPPTTAYQTTLIFPNLSVKTCYTNIKPYMDASHKTTHSPSNTITPISAEKKAESPA